MIKLNPIILFLALILSASVCFGQIDSGELEEGIAFYEQGSYQL